LIELFLWLLAAVFLKSFRETYVWFAVSRAHCDSEWEVGIVQLEIRLKRKVCSRESNLSEKFAAGNQIRSGKIAAEYQTESGKFATENQNGLGKFAAEKQIDSGK